MLKFPIKRVPVIRGILLPVAEGMFFSFKLRELEISLDVRVDYFFNSITNNVMILPCFSPSAG